MKIWSGSAPRVGMEGHHFMVVFFFSSGPDPLKNPSQLGRRRISFTPVMSQYCQLQFLVAASRSMKKCLPFLILNTVILWHLDHTMHRILPSKIEMLLQFQLQFQLFKNLIRKMIQQDQTNDVLVLWFNFLLSAFC